MEENVVSASGSTKTDATELELQRMIISAGFVPVKRDSEYNKLDARLQLGNKVESIAIRSQ